MSAKLTKNINITKYAEFLFGVLLVAISFNMFILNNNIVYGMSGVGVMLNEAFGIDPSLVIFTGSGILLIFSFILLGYQDTRNTIVGSLLYPALIKLTEPLTAMLNPSEVDSTIAIICGSILTGIGLGFVFKAGFTTGGSDILNSIISKYARVGMGKAMLFTNSILVLSSIFVFGFTSGIYSVIMLYVVGAMTDKVMLGISQSKAFYIVTEKEEKVKKYVLSRLSHSVTVLDAEGGYTGKNKKVIMCIIPTREYYIFKEAVKAIDPDAFFLVTDAYEVSGGA